MNGTLRPGQPPDCPKEWCALMDRCWATQPSKRATFTEVADTLDEMVIRYGQQDNE